MLEEDEAANEAGVVSRKPRDKVPAVAKSSSKMRTGQGHLHLATRRSPPAKGKVAGREWEVRKEAERVFLPVKAVSWQQGTCQDTSTVPRDVVGRDSGCGGALASGRRGRWLRSGERQPSARGQEARPQQGNSG